MEHKIISQEKNPFLSREEFKLQISAEANPTEDAVKEAVGKDADLTVVKKLGNGFGKNEFTADVVVYDSAEEKEKVETIPKKVRKKMEEEKKAAEEAAAKKAEEEKKAAEEAAAAPAEDAPKEEAPAETPEAPAEEKTEEVKEEKKEE